MATNNSLHRLKSTSVVSRYKRAIDVGHDSYAMFNLGTCYETGEGVGKDMRMAFKFYEMAARAGHSDAQYIVGACYELGEGVEVDMKQAVRYYRLASNVRHVKAMYNLGRMYYAGRGVSVQYFEAVSWYSRSNPA